MKIEQTALEKVKQLNQFSQITESYLQTGERLSKSVKDFDRPEENLSAQELLALSAYYEYVAEIESRKELAPSDEYKFDEEDMQDGL